MLVVGRFCRRGMDHEEARMEARAELADGIAVAVLVAPAIDVCATGNDGLDDSDLWS